MLKAVVNVVAVLAGLIAFDQLMLWLERRGWVYWRKRRRAGGGGLAGVLTDFQGLVEPQVRRVIEDREERNAIRIDRAAGPPPSRGDASDNRGHDGLGRATPPAQR